MRALLDSSYPWMYAFFICSGANRPEMLQRTREILAPVLRVCPRCWLHVVLTKSRSRPGRRKKQENEKPCSGFLPSQRCLEEVVAVRAQPGPKSFSGLARTLPSHWAPVCAPSLASPARRGGGGSQREGIQFLRRWIDSNIWFHHGSQGLLTEEIKVYLFLAQYWHSSLQLCVTRAWMSSLTAVFTVATPKLHHPSLFVPFGKKIF